MRPRLLLPLALFAWVSFSWLPIPPSHAQEAGWTMGGRDASHTATELGPEPPYREVWSVEVGRGGPVAGVAATEAIVAVVTQEAVLALDPEDGTELWAEDRVSGVAGVPAIAGEMVLHASGEAEDGQIVARDLESGAPIWERVLGGKIRGGPTVADETVFVGTSTELVALELESGKIRWRFTTTGSVGAPAVADGIVVAASYDSVTGTPTTYGIDAVAGGDEGPEWQVSPGAVGPPSAPSISGDRAYVGTGDRNVHALNLDDGSEIWTTASRGPFGPRQFPAAGALLVVADRSYAYRLDPATGEEAWVYQLADLRPLGPDRFNTLLDGAPSISGDTVLLGAGDGTLSAIDGVSGARVWRRDLGDAAAAPVAVTGDRLYAATLGEEGTVVALEHDPEGRLLHEASPTELFPGRALLNFVLAAAAVGAGVLLLFRVGLRPRSAT